MPDLSKLRELLQASRDRPITPEEYETSRQEMEAAEAQLQQQPAITRAIFGMSPAGQAPPPATPRPTPEEQQVAQLRAMGVQSVPPDDPIYQQGTTFIVPPSPTADPPPVTTRAQPTEQCESP